MAPVAVSFPVSPGNTLSNSTVPGTLLDVLSRAVRHYTNHELSFITSSAHDSSTQTRTFREFNQHAISLAKAVRAWGKPTGSVIVVYLTEHEDNMTALWACLLAGYVPCFQPALSAQQAHKEGHVAHIKKLFSSVTWLTNERGADQLQSLSGLDIHLLSDLETSTENMGTDFVVHQPNPDDEVILFLTSGPTGFSKAVVHTHRTIVAACRAKGQSYGLTSQSKIMNWVGFSPTFDLNGEDASGKLFATHRALRDVSVKMITLPPQFIIPIDTDQMEKTTLGKFSRDRLLNQFKQGGLSKDIARAEEPELLSVARGSSLIVPSTEMEKTLARIYAGIFNLNVGDISVGDNFFELGGTSIDVIRLKREGESAFDRPEIPTMQILKNPVLSSPAKYIDSSTSEDVSTEYDPIVPLNLTGSKIPIFMVHPGAGDVLIFVNLAKYFHDERPFYALRARGFEPEDALFGSMDEMVSCYATAVKRTQPHGPYAIAGYSYGGVVAFEVAKRLEAMGNEVKFTGVINIPPYITDRMHELDWTCAMLNLLYFLGLVDKQDANDLAPALRPLTREKQLDAVWRLSPPERLLKLQLTPEKLDHWVDIAGSLIECGKTYEPSGSVLSVDVFYATPLRGSKANWLNKQLKAWTGFSRGEPSYTDVPGKHYTLMDVDHALGFQKIFRGRLEARGL